MRKFIWGAGALLSVLVLILGISFIYLRSSLPANDGEHIVRGLGGEVEILWDSLGVPHIRASSEEDLYFALGYLHARDRLWQMDLFRRVADGRLAEVLGPQLVETDRFLRTLGLGRAARVGAAALDPDRRPGLEAYAAGVNAWLDGRRGALPPEFVVLRFEPEPWEVEHSLMLEKIMAWDLTSYERELNLARSVRSLDPARAMHLMPEYPEWGTDILEVKEILASVDLPDEVPPAAAALLDALSVTRASNSWVISGERTRSGKPILANDMHLSLTSPSLWYLAAMQGGGLDVVGMTLPGAPYVVAGHNRAIAWGLTNAYLDDADLVIERLDPSDPTRYLTPEGSEPFEVLVDTIWVKGQDEPVIHEIRSTRNGPVLSGVPGADGVARDGEGDLLALRWVGHLPSRTWRALAALNRAANWEEFLAAVEEFDNPHQNVVYADTAGRIGYKMGGRVPLRGEGKRPPQLPVPGWTGEWDWTGWLPFSAHPELLDPEEGFVVTANNRQVAGEAGEQISTWWDEPFRAQRIRELLEGEGSFDAESVHRQQLDVRDAMAERYRDVAVAAAEGAGLEGAAALLRDWDLEARIDSRGAALFYTWHQRLRRLVTRSLYDGTTGGWFPRDALTAVLERRALAWVEGGGASEFEELAMAAMLEADSIAGGKTLGDLQYVKADHALSQVPVLTKLLRLDVGPRPIGGSPTTVNVATSASAGGDRWQVTHGASQRHVVDMGDIDGAGGFILPTGQSGIPFSKQYRDQFERWREGGLWPIPLDRERARSRSMHRMVLRPGGR